VASAPLGDATKGSPGGQGMYSGSSARAAVSEFPGPAGNPLHAGRGYGRQSAARQQRPFHGDRAGPEGHLQLLHPRLLQHQLQPGRPLPPHQGADREQPLGQAGLPQRLLCLQGIPQVRHLRRERQLQEALMLGDPVTDLSVAMEINYSGWPATATSSRWR